MTEDSFLSTPAGDAWRRLGARRRAGVCVPLFSVWSSRSAGVGEYPDIPLLADWCRATGQSVIQLLPLNDAGFDHAPYSAQSSFALEPLHLSLENLSGVDAAAFSKDIAALKARFPIGRRVNYAVKAAKLELLHKMFSSLPAAPDPAFRAFQARHAGWLPDYALYKALKDSFSQSAWESWPAPLRDRHPQALQAARGEQAAAVLFQEWLQWQCALQMEAAHREANARGVFLMGDLPFLVSRDSADVWTFRDAFKLDMESGAPPDMYSASGQRWGMPPYDWSSVSAGGWRYPSLKLKTAEAYYDLYRIDHVIGVFRLFVVPMDEPAENGARNGRFDPADRAQWEDHGRKILSMMLSQTHMLPCGEDLGDVPVCSDRVLADFGIPGLNVQRWRRDWEGTRDFIPSSDYRRNACAVLSTHDSCLFTAWWDGEATDDDKRRFCVFLGAGGAPLSTLDALRAALSRASESAAVFSIQLAQDYWAAGGSLPGDPADWRVNVPGTVGPRNWSVVLPHPLEAWGSLPVNAFLKALHERTGRG